MRTVMSRREYLALMARYGTLFGFGAMISPQLGCGGGGKIGEFNNTIGSASIPNPENYDLDDIQFSTLYNKPFYLPDSLFGEGLYLPQTSDLPNGARITNREHIIYILQATTDLEIDFAYGLIPHFEQSQSDLDKIINKEDVYYINDWAMKCHVGLCGGVNFNSAPHIFSASYGATKFGKSDMLNKGVSQSDLNIVASNQLLNGQSLTTSEQNALEDAKQRIANIMMNDNVNQNFHVNLRVMRSHAEIYGDGPSDGAKDRQDAQNFFEALIDGDNKFSVRIPTRMPSMVTAHEVNHSTVLDVPSGRFHPNEGKLKYGERLAEHGSLISKANMRSLYQQAPTEQISKFLQARIDQQIDSRLGPGENDPREGYVEASQFFGRLSGEPAAPIENERPIYRIYDPAIGDYESGSELFSRDVESSLAISASGETGHDHEH